MGPVWSGRNTEGLRETPVDVYGVLDWLATSARDLLTPISVMPWCGCSMPSSPTGMV
jgi:hypothetical protein